LAAGVLAFRNMSVEEQRSLAVSASRLDRGNLSWDIGVSSLNIHEQARFTKSQFSRAKRTIDIVAGSAALVLLGSPMAILAIFIRCKLGSPVFFRQTRVGRNGQSFELVKFRSMTNTCDASGVLLPDCQRITTFGATLRCTSLDEFPELWNVIRGDMSLVGPRPLLARYTEYFTDEERLRLLVRPGITGWAQVNGRNTASWNKRLGMDAWYVRNRSFRLDIRIMCMTLAQVFLKSGVVVDPESMMQDLDDERRDRTDIK